MSYKTLERLECLRTLNSNKQWVNHDVYRLMYKEDLYMLAYERMRKRSTDFRWKPFERLSTR